MQGMEKLFFVVITLLWWTAATLIDAQLRIVTEFGEFCRNQLSTGNFTHKLSFSLRARANCNINVSVPSTNRIRIIFHSPSNHCHGNLILLDDGCQVTIRPCGTITYISARSALRISLRHLHYVNVTIAEIQRSPVQDDVTAAILELETPSASGTIRLQPWTPSIIIKTNLNQHVRLRIPDVELGSENIDSICRDNFLHIGSDIYNINKQTATAYKLCGKMGNEEFISRSNGAWMTLYGGAGELNVMYDSKAAALCDDRNASFPCSPVQCVDAEQVCDGTLDCSNSLDEYCDGESVRDWCFLCADGRCMNPRRPFYDYHANAELWWLCDGYNHCMDGTDERIDICFDLRSRRETLFDCLTANRTTVTLRRLMCDGTEHCPNGEDEDDSVCSPGDEGESTFPTSLFYLGCTVTGFSLVAIFVCHYLGKRVASGEQPLRNEQNSRYSLTSTAGTNRDDKQGHQVIGQGHDLAVGEMVEMELITTEIT